MWMLRWVLVVVLALPALYAQVAPPASTVAPAAAKIWVDRYAEFEEFIGTAPIDRIETIPIGVTRPRRAFFKPGGLVRSVALKALTPGRVSGYWESYRSEIAAYELDKLLGMEMVPVTVEKRVNGELMSAQLWVEDSVWLKTLAGQSSPDIAHWNRQVYRHRVFDNLVANIDRNEGNLLVVRDPLWHLVLIDHSRAFASTMSKPFPMTRIDRPFFERLRALDEPTLRARIGSLLAEGVKPLLKRRDAIVAHFEKLAAEQGEARVFVPE